MLRWPNTAFARVLDPVMQFSAPQVLLKNKHGINKAINLFAQCPHYLCYFSSQGMLEKVTMQIEKPAQLFLCYQKNPVKCSACVEGGKKLRLSEKLTSRRYAYFSRTTH